MSVLVLSDDLGGSWVQVDGTCEVLTLPDALDPVDEADVAIAASSAADVTVSGTAGALDAWLWHRAGRDGIAVEGDEAVWATVQPILDQPAD